MGALALIKRRSVSGTIVTVTSREDAVRQSIERLDPNPEKLIAEIERNILQQRGERLIVSARAGDYTPEVVVQVAELYRSQGWHVEIGHYWMHLT